MSDSVRNIIQDQSLYRDGNKEDTRIWGIISDGTFSLSSTYNFIESKDDNVSSKREGFDLILEGTSSK